MSFKNFQPTVYAASFLREIDQKLVFAQLFSREYTGEVAKLGDEIVFMGIGDPTITPVADKTGIISAGTVESLEDVSLIMKVEQADTFYFGVGDIDRELAKNGEGILGRGRKRAAHRQAEKIDKYLASLFKNKTEAKKMYTVGSEPVLTKANIMGYIDGIVQSAEEKGMTSGQLYAVITPRFKKLLKQAYTDLDTDNSEMLKNGFVGKYNSITFVLSNHVANSGTINSTSQIDYIPVFTRDACGYAHPFAEVEPERLQGKFGDAVKGLTLYDGKIIYTKEVMVMNVKYHADSL